MDKLLDKLMMYVHWSIYVTSIHLVNLRIFSPEINRKISKVGTWSSYKAEELSEKNDFKFI